MVDITKEDINLCDSLEISQDENGTEVINGVLELWMTISNLNEYFGTEMTEEDDSYINAYVIYYPETKDVKVEFDINEPDGDIRYDEKELTKEEKIFFREMMENYCHKKYGCKLEELVKL